MDRYDAAQVVLQFIFNNQGTDTSAILSHVQREVDPTANLAGIGEVVDWLHKNNYADGTFTFGPDALFLKPTEKGERAILSGKTIKELLSQSDTQSVSNVSHTYNTTTGNVGQLAQGDGHTLNQTINVSISTGDLAPVLEAMRSHGDTKTADEIEKIHQAGDNPGVLRRLFERFSSKAVDAAADRAVDAALSPDYAAEILPMISDLAVSAFGGA